MGRLEASNREADHKCEICVKESGGFEQKGHMKKKRKRNQRSINDDQQEVNNSQRRLTDEERQRSPSEDFIFL